MSRYFLGGPCTCLCHYARLCYFIVSFNNRFFALSVFILTLYLSPSLRPHQHLLAELKRLSSVRLQRCSAPRAHVACSLHAARAHAPRRWEGARGRSAEPRAPNEPERANPTKQASNANRIEEPPIGTSARPDSKFELERGLLKPLVNLRVAANGKRRRITERVRVFRRDRRVCACVCVRA